eukprot:Gb_07890 [translate_table: standard]
MEFGRWHCHRKHLHVAFNNRPTRLLTRTGQDLLLAVDTWRSGNQSTVGGAPPPGGLRRLRVRGTDCRRGYGHVDCDDIGDVADVYKGFLIGVEVKFKEIPQQHQNKENLGKTVIRGMCHVAFDDEVTCLELWTDQAGQKSYGRARCVGFVIGGHWRDELIELGKLGIGIGWDLVHFLLTSSLKIKGGSLDDAKGAYGHGALTGLCCIDLIGSEDFSSDSEGTQYNSSAFCHNPGSSITLSRDLLERLIMGTCSQEDPVKKEEEEIDGEMELNLGLSLGGCLGKAKKENPTLQKVGSGSLQPCLRKFALENLNDVQNETKELRHRKEDGRHNFGFASPDMGQNSIQATPGLMTPPCISHQQDTVSEMKQEGVPMTQGQPPMSKQQQEMFEQQRKRELHALRRQEARKKREEKQQKKARKEGRKSFPPSKVKNSSMPLPPSYAHFPMRGRAFPSRTAIDPLDKRVLETQMSFIREKDRAVKENEPRSERERTVCGLPEQGPHKGNLVTEDKNSSTSHEDEQMVSSPNDGGPPTSNEISGLERTSSTSHPSYPVLPMPYPFPLLAGNPQSMPLPLGFSFPYMMPFWAAPTGTEPSKSHNIPPLGSNVLQPVPTRAFPPFPLPISPTPPSWLPTRPGTTPEQSSHASGASPGRSSSAVSDYESRSSQVHITPSTVMGRNHILLEADGYHAFTLVGIEYPSEVVQDYVNPMSLPYANPLSLPLGRDNKSGASSNDTKSQSSSSSALEPSHRASSVSNSQDQILGSSEVSASSQLEPTKCAEDTLDTVPSSTAQSALAISSTTTTTTTRERKVAEASSTSKPPQNGSPSNSTTHKCSDLKTTEAKDNCSLPHMPCVSTTGDGPNGKTISGFLYSYSRGEVSIVCVCHGTFLSPAEFVQHAGGTDILHPERHIVVNPSLV